MKVSGRLKHMGESQMGDKKRQAGKRYFTSELFYHGMILPGMIFVLLFNFVPMFGIVMAFQDYKPAKGFFGSAFVGMKGRGLPVCTIIRGNVVAEDGKITAEKGVGTLVRRLS